MVRSQDADSLSTVSIHDAEQFTRGRQIWLILTLRHVVHYCIVYANAEYLQSDLESLFSFIKIPSGLDT